jgi:hypothetical protein
MIVLLKAGSPIGLPHSTTTLNGRQKQFKAEAFQPLVQLDVFFRQTVEKKTFKS